MKRTSQPKLYQGIVLLVGGFIIFLIFMLTLILTFVTGNATMLVAVGLLSLGLAAWLMIWGIMYLHNYRMSLLAKEKGRPSECVVLSKRVVSSRVEVFFQVFVKYRGQKSGLYYEHIVNATEDFYMDVKVGDKIRCSVYEDSCYVDPDYPLLIA